MRLLIDFTLFVSPVAESASSLSLPVFAEMQTREIDGETRRYYAAHPPYLLIVVCRNGLSLDALSGCIVDASIGWDAGRPGYVLPENEGRRHTKITVYRVLERPQDLKRLSEVMAAAPLAHEVTASS